MFESDSLYRAKAIGIILMVMGHALSPELFWRRYIYLFHMPMFYLLSGYLFSDKYLADWKLLLARKAKALYLPYVKFGILFILLHNVFRACYLLDDGGYTLTDTVHMLFRNICFLETEPLLGATWFLRSLFITTMLYYGAIRLGRLVSANVLAINVFVMVAAFIAGGALHVLHCSFPFWIDREVFCAGFFALGKIVRIGNVRLPSRAYVIPIAFALLLLLNNFTHVKLHVNDIGNPLLSIVSAIAGTYLVLVVAKYCNLPQLTFLGKQTMPILIWHLFFFKACTLLVIGVYHLPISSLSAFPIVYDYPLWWIAYTTVGIVGGLAMSRVPFLRK